MPQAIAAAEPDALSAVSGFVHSVRSTIEDIQKIAQILNTARSCIIEVSNDTKLDLTVTNKETSHGKFIAPMPKERLPKQSSDTYGAGSDAGSFLTGTEGVVTYSNDVFDARVHLVFTCHFDNPWAGGNSASALAIGPGANVLFTISATAGAGDEHAPMQFIIAHNLGKFVVVNRATNKVLDVIGNSHDRGMQVQQYLRNNGRNQQWRFAPIDGRYYHIYSEESVQVLDVRGKRADGALQQFPLNAQGDRDNQSWEFIAQSPFVLPFLPQAFVIKNKLTGRVLDVPNGDPATNVVQQGDLNNPPSDNQLWHLQSI